MKLPSFVQKALIAVLTTYFKYLAMVVVAAIFAIGYVWFIRPQFNNVRIVGVLALKNETDRLNDRLAYYERAKKMVDQYRTASEGLGGITGKILPTVNSNADLFKLAQAVAREANMSLDSVVISQGRAATAGAAATNTNQAAKPVTSASGTIQVVDVSVSLSGGTTYADYKRLLSVMEKSIRLLDVGLINYKPVAPIVSAPGRPNAVEAPTKTTLTFKTYYLDTGAVKK